MSLHIQRAGNESNPCDDKLSFETKQQAEGAKVLAKLEHGNKDLQVYLCDTCNLWHLATTHDTED